MSEHNGLHERAEPVDECGIGKLSASDLYGDVPVLLKHVFLAYRARVLSGFPLDAKEFAAAHAACRAALAHFMLLLRLAERFAGPDGSSAEAETFNVLIAEARSALKAVEPCNKDGLEPI